MKILVSGIGIAGAAAALYLRRDGHDLTLIDKAPAFQRRGYALSLKSFGNAVMQQLGLLAALQDRAIPVNDIATYAADGTLLKDFAVAAAITAAKGATAAYRADLHELLYAAVGSRDSVRHGLEIGAIEDHGATVYVALSDGSVGHYDLLVIAEGLWSTSRRLCWSDHCLRPFPVIYAASDIELNHGVPLGTVEMHTGPGASFGIIPVSESRTLIHAYCRGSLTRGGDQTAAKQLLRSRYERFSPRIVDLVERLCRRDEIFLDAIALVSLPSLSSGRVVLLGDAGYCPTFLSGMGASLGLIGATALAKALRTEPQDRGAALARYNAWMQPLARHFQSNAIAHVESLLTLNPLKLRLRDWAVRWIPGALLARSFGRQFAAEAELVRDILSA